VFTDKKELENIIEEMDHAGQCDGQVRREKDHEYGRKDSTQAEPGEKGQNGNQERCYGNDDDQSSNL
jgi:hypothetical protein